MPITVINSNTTTQVKLGSGILQAVLISSPGSAWTMQLKDGPNPVGGGLATIMGATAFTVPAVGTNLLPQPIPFNNGLQIVTAGTTPGEIEIVWQ